MSRATFHCGILYLGVITIAVFAFFSLQTSSIEDSPALQQLSVSIREATPERIAGRFHLMSDYAAARLIRAHENPYEVVPDELFKRYPELKRYSYRDRFNPPFYFLFILPFSLLPADLFFLIGALLLVGVALGSTAIAWRLWNEHTETPLLFVVVASCLFAPIPLAISSGQLGLVLTLVFLLALQQHRQGNDFLAGSLLGVTLCKPQSIYLALVTLLLQALLQRRFKFLLGFLAMGILLLESSLTTTPVLWPQFMQIASPIHNKTATLATLVRDVILLQTGQIVEWPVAAVSGATLLITSFYVLIKKGQLSDKCLYALLPGLSVATQAYGWFYDFSALLPCLSFLFAASAPQQLRLLGLAICPLSYLLLLIPYYPFQITLPLVLLCILFFEVKMNVT